MLAGLDIELNAASAKIRQRVSSVFESRSSCKVPVAASTESVEQTSSRRAGRKTQPERSPTLSTDSSQHNREFDQSNRSDARGATVRSHIGKHKCAARGRSGSICALKSSPSMCKGLRQRGLSRHGSKEYNKFDGMYTTVSAVESPDSAAYEAGKWFKAPTTGLNDSLDGRAVSWLGQSSMSNEWKSRLFNSESTLEAGNRNTDPGNNSQEPPFNVAESSNDTLDMKVRITQRNAGVPGTNFVETNVSILEGSDNVLFEFAHTDANLFGRQMVVHKAILFACRLCGIQSPPLSIPIDSCKLFDQLDNMKHIHSFMSGMVGRINAASLGNEIQTYWWRAVGNGALIIQNNASGMLHITRNTERSLSAAVDCVRRALSSFRATKTAQNYLESGYPTSAEVLRDLKGKQPVEKPLLCVSCCRCRASPTFRRDRCD
jgi:hypothetical protein